MSLHYLLMSNHQLLQKYFLDHLHTDDLSLGQPKVLDYLQDHDGAIQREIAASCHIEPASLSRILDGMERGGWIRRKRDAENRRRTCIFMTDRAKRALPEINRAFREAEEVAFRGFSDKEKVELLALLERSFDNLRRVEDD